MNKQKLREKKDFTRWVDGYEHNLSLVLESLKYELSDVNRDKKLQYNTAKTLLWLNVVFVGISIKILEYHPNIWLFSLFVVISSLSILFTFLGMIEGKYNAYASPGRVSMYAKLPNDEWIKSNGLLSNIHAFRRAIKYNGISLIKRSRWIRKAKYASVLSFVVLLILSVNSLYLNTKGLEMAKQPTTPTKSVINPGPIRRTASQKPVKLAAPKPLNSSKK